MVLAGDGSLAARTTVYMLLAGVAGKHHERDGGMHRQGLQRASQRGCALGIDEHGSRHDYVRVLARRRDTRDGLLHRRGRLAPKKDPGMMQLVVRMSFRHGSSAIRVISVDVRDGPECERDRAGMYTGCRYVSTERSSVRRRSL